MVFAALGSGTQVYATDVNNFVISNYTVDMRLGMDDERRSTLKTTETITAEFPDYDQNRGLERAIPKSYDGHSTNLEIVSVRDQNDQSRMYTTYDDSNGNLIVRMADMSKYVYGTQVYKLTYTQRDVTQLFGNTTAVDEFYWDINGTDWRVPIENLSASVHFAPDVASEFNGQSICYQGFEGSTDQCELQQKDASFSTTVQNLSPGQNVTVAFGFKPNTFSPYQKTLWEQLVYWWWIVQLVTLIIAAGLSIWLIRKYQKQSNREDEMGPIAPEYLPPAHASLTVSAQITDEKRGSVMTAQLLDLAVRHYVKIYETKEKKWYRSGEYEVEVTRDATELKPEVQELLNDMFGHTPVVGEKLNLKKLQNNTAYYRRTQDNDKQLKSLVEGRYNLRTVDVQGRAEFRRIAGIVMLVAVLSLLSIPLFITSLLAFVFSFTLTPLTDTGLELRRYLKGLKLYISVAEEKRLEMLQSPTGAQKVSTIVNTTAGQKSLIKLYERVLPYAVLFGQEKEWTRQLGVYYEQIQAQPGWYSGHSAFNAAVFSSAISGLGQATSYANSSSSSSGGSTGGGSSGGGGGGGGGGGV